ncbi:MAG: hypothetical protein IPK64_16600 [bacterium]|nr:hypothetical protein [bacterium]
MVCTLFLLAGLAGPLAGTATASVGGPYYQVTWGLAAGNSATLLVVPDGTGNPLTAARNPFGQIVDATIHLQANDDSGPLQGVPAADLWLGAEDEGLVLCAGGSTADHATDALGHTEWTRPLLAGGHSQAPCHVYVNGHGVQAGVLALKFNSPDIDGNLRVDLSDVARFAADFVGHYAFRSDLIRDGSVNLSDIVEMNRALGRKCP